MTHAYPFPGLQPGPDRTWAGIGISSRRSCCPYFRQNSEATSPQSTTNARFRSCREQE
jgi:hypothetical protein